MGSYRTFVLKRRVLEVGHCGIFCTKNGRETLHKKTGSLLALVEPDWTNPKFTSVILRLMSVAYQLVEPTDA